MKHQIKFFWLSQGFLALVSNLKMKEMLTLLASYEGAIVLFGLSSQKRQVFFEKSSNLKITLILVSVTLVYYLVIILSLYCNMRCKCYSNIMYASNKFYCIMCWIHLEGGKWYSLIINSLFFAISSLIELRTSACIFSGYSFSTLPSPHGPCLANSAFIKEGSQNVVFGLPLSIAVHKFHSSNYCYSNNDNNSHNYNHYVTDYENIVVFPSVSDVTFKDSLKNYLNSLDKDSFYVILFYTYNNQITPLKRRGDCLVSSGVFYYCAVYKNSMSIDGIYEDIKKSFFEKVNSLENEYEYLFSEDSCYVQRWIDNNEVSFAKIFDLGDITDKSVFISGSDPVEEEDDSCSEPGISSFTINSNDVKFYNNSFKSKGLFSQEKRISINYNKALLLSTNGIKLKRNFHTYTINRLLVASFGFKVQFISRASSSFAYAWKRDLFYYISGFTPHRKGSSTRRYYSSNEEKKIKINLHPDYVAGLCDGESTFTISISKDNRIRKSSSISNKSIIFNVHPSFAISLNIKDIQLIYSLQSFFCVGNIKHDSKNNAVTFYVNSVEDLIDAIIPFFKDYPLLTQKWADFILFEKAVNLIKKGAHLTTEGLTNIVSIKGAMNKGLSEKLIAQFPDIHLVDRPLVLNQTIRSGHWLAGFTDGEGSFYVRIQEANTAKSVNRVSFFFSIDQSIRVSVRIYKFSRLHLAPLIAKQQPFWNKAVITRAYSTSTVTPPSLVASTQPVKIYANTDIQKTQIIKENRKCAGIYCWTHLSSGQCYIGSSIDLGIRFRQYFNYDHLTRNSMVIYKALLKHGYSAFSLEILEYCIPDKVIEREQYYLDLLKPAYNILKIAGSRFGYLHSKETIAKMKERRHSEETKSKISISMKGNKHSDGVKAKISVGMKGKGQGRKLSEETIAKMSYAKKGVEKSTQTRAKLSAANGSKILVVDTLTDNKTKYDSIRKASEGLGASYSTIHYYVGKDKLYLARYKIIILS